MASSSQISPATHSFSVFRDPAGGDRSSPFEDDSSPGELNLAAAEDVDDPEDDEDEDELVDDEDELEDDDIEDDDDPDAHEDEFDDEDEDEEDDEEDDAEEAGAAPALRAGGLTGDDDLLSERDERGAG